MRPPHPVAPRFNLSISDPLMLPIPPDARGERLDSALARLHPELSRTGWQRLIKTGCVTLDGLIPSPKVKLKGGELVQAQIPPPEPLDLVPVAMDLNILFEDEHLIVLVKPAGLVVHPAASVKEPTLVHGLLHRGGGFTGIGGAERPGIVHRLDKGTSGVMVVAKSDVAHRGLVALFKRHDIDRVYTALVRGAPRDLTGTWRSVIGRNPRNRLKMATVTKGGRNAVTHYTRKKVYAGASLMEFRLETGRTHQIRVHSSENGHPVVGDATYGGVAPKSLPPDTQLQAALKTLDHQLLHASVLGFVHPVSGVALRFEVEPPEDFQAIHDRLIALS